MVTEESSDIVLEQGPQQLNHWAAKTDRRYG